MVLNESKSKNWFLTVPNYNDADLMFFQSLEYGDRVLYAIVGKEVGEGGLLHLQCVISFKSRTYFSAVKKFLTFSQPCHIEVCKNVKHSIKYCQKEGDYTEYGSPPTSSGHRSDLEDFKLKVQSGEFDINTLIEDHSEVFARYYRFALTYIDLKKPIRPPDEHELSAWQSTMYELLSYPPNDRTIFFVVDVDGNNGKTWFAHYYTFKNPNSQVIPPGKKNDMVFALKENVTCLFLDCPRSKQGDYIQYDFLEEVKNGYIFSPKYESRVKRLPKCHVVVLMNEPPDLTKLSEDRYHVINI